MIGKFVIGKLNHALGNGRKIIVAVGLAAGLLAAAACGGGEPTSDAGGGAGRGGFGGSENLTVVKAPEFQTSLGFRYLVGQLKNSSGRRLEYAEVSCSISQNGVQQATALDSTTNLGAGEIWPYKARFEVNFPGGRYRIYCDSSSR